MNDSIINIAAPRIAQSCIAVDVAEKANPNSRDPSDLRMLRGSYQALGVPLLGTDEEAPPPQQQQQHPQVVVRLGRFLNTRRLQNGSSNSLTSMGSRSSSVSSMKSAASASGGDGGSRNINSLSVLEPGLTRPASLRTVMHRAGLRTRWGSAARISLVDATRSALALQLTAYKTETTPPHSPIADAPTHGPAWEQVGITIANCLVGAGCLGLPYALRQAGWAGLLIILLATMATCLTAKMLVRSIETLNRRKLNCTTYDELVDLTFGSFGGMVMRVMTILELYGGIVCMVVLHAVNWPPLLNLPPSPLASIAASTPGLAFLEPLEPLVSSRGLVTACVCALALPTLLVQPRHLSAFATIGLASTAMVACVTVAAPILADLPLPDGATCPYDPRAAAAAAAAAASSTAADTPEAASSPLPPTTQHTMARAILHLEGLGVATGLALFAFAGHATFPEMWRQMPASQRPHFGSACNLGFGLAALFYCALASVGYYFFGECAADSLTLNLLDVSHTLGGVATGGVLLSTFTSISVLAVPVVRILREAAACGDTQTIARLRMRDASFTAGWLQQSDAITLSIKALLMAIAALLALTVPNFGFIVALIGAFTCMLISLILPTLCNLAVHWGELSSCALLLNFAIVAVGCVGMVVGVRATLEGEG